MSTYRNPWHRPGHFDGGPEFYSCDSEPTQLGKYLRFYRIKSSDPSARCYDYVYDGVCFAQRAGPKTEEEIDADRYAQTNLARFCGVSFGPMWEDD